MLNATTDKAHHAARKVPRGWHEVIKVAFCLQKALYFLSHFLLAASDTERHNSWILESFLISRLLSLCLVSSFSDFTLLGVPDLKLKEVAVPLGVLGLKPAHVPPH